MNTYKTESSGIIINIIYEYIRLMAHGHSLTTHHKFVYIEHYKTNEISFTTHHLDIAYYVLMYHTTL
jgi:hypothetical protein